MSERFKLLFAYDGSECSEAALEDLEYAGLPSIADATVLSVAELWLPPPSSYALAETDFGDHLADHFLEAQAGAERARERLLARFPTWEVRAQAERGGAARTILEACANLQPDLVVVGSHGRSALGRFVIGSVSHQVVTEAPCSVRVARPRHRERKGPLRLVVGFADTASCECVKAMLARREWPAGTEVALTTAFGPYEAFGDTLEAILEHIREIHARTSVEIERLGLKVRSELREGDPRKLVIEFADAWDADCILVGTRDLNRAGRVLLGSVSTTVVHRAHCSVEVVR